MRRWVDGRGSSRKGAGVDVVGVIGTIAVVALVLVLAYQAHELANHTEVANQVAGAEAHRELMSMAGRVYQAFLAYPELRPFFYDETEATPSEAQRNQLVSVAEMYADSLQTALDTLTTLAWPGGRRRIPRCMRELPALSKEPHSWVGEDASRGFDRY